MSNDKCKIAYLFGSLNRGGTETLFLDVFRNASKASFGLIGFHRKDGAYRDEFYTAGPKMVHLAPKRFGYIRYLVQLRQLLKSEHITIVHAQHWLDGIYAWLATIGTDIRVINTFHGYFPMKGLNGLLCRMSIRMADEMCFVSRYEQEWYQQQIRIDDRKCHVIFNGVDFAKIDGVECNVYGVKERIKLCMVGNFVEVRDHRTLVRALAMLKGLADGRMSGLEYDFYFIGKRSEDYPYIYDECVRVCDENKMTNVHFLGGRGDVPELLKQMDGFVYSTDHDTFGIAVVEAMAAGLPVVVNDYPVMKEVCGEEESNYVTYYRSKDVDDCAEAIIKLLEDIKISSNEFKQQCQHNSIFVRERYSIENYIATLSHIYRKD